LLVSAMRMGILLGRPWGGRVAVLLLALEPNFLAHASLATTDIALAACFMAFTVEFLIRREQTTVWRIGVPTLWFGLAISAKVSGLALLPFAIVAATLRAHHDRTELRRLATDTIAILGLGLAFTVLYCGPVGRRG
jgi:predicted membrane-bound dolichyl-phosphate-mannose-protein mannosyltransferase